MTPLAHAIVKELTMPKKERSFQDRCGLLAEMSDIHCFEVSAVLELARELIIGPARAVINVEQRGAAILERAQSISDFTSFLPAPRTWLEWTNEFGGRTGLLCTNDTTDGWIRIRGAESGGGSFLSGDRQYKLSLRDVNAFQISAGGSELDDTERLSLCSLMVTVHGLLALINTPHIIGRRTHAPHRGLERKLLAKKKLVGRFPLRAWTEIVLHVTPPVDEGDAASQEVHFTGSKALHFVRCHLRVRLGRLELVTAHWRGDPALGIKQTRYRLAA